MNYSIPPYRHEPKHRASGPLGKFTVHSPEDYRPKHRRPS